VTKRHRSRCRLWRRSVTDDLRELWPHDRRQENVGSPPCGLPPHSRRCRRPVYPSRSHRTPQKNGGSSRCCSATSRIDALSARGGTRSEDMRAVIEAYQSACAPTSSRARRFVAKFMGAGCSPFRLSARPQDEAERSVRAAWRIARPSAACRRGTRAPTGCASGIATGLVVVGDLIGTGARGTVGVRTETAQQCRGAAGARPAQRHHHRPRRRRSQVGSLFAFIDLGQQTEKGFDRRLQPAWRVCGPRRSDGANRLQGCARAPLRGWTRRGDSSCVRHWASANRAKPRRD